MRPFVTQVLEAAAAAEKAAESAAAAADGVAEDAERAMTAADSAEEAAKRAEEALEQMGPGGGGSGTVTSVNGVQPDEAGNVEMDIPQTAEDVGADPAGTAASKVSTHNADEEAHPAIRQLITTLSGRLNALADSDDTTLDQLSEIVTYIKANKTLIDSITTGKVSTADIVNNLTSTATNKPLSAAQGKALKALIDAIAVPTKLSELAGDATHRVVTDAEKAAWNAKSTFSGAYADLTGKPTKVSAFENDAGYLTEHQDISHLLPRTELGTAVDVALAEAKASGAFDGKDGKTPVKGTDYWTPADQESIVQQVIAALGTPVFGRVDADNNIILTGNLESATYTVKYENEDGTLTDIGTISFEAVAYTNLADQASADWLVNKRINSSGVLTDAAGVDITNFIPVTDSSVLHIKGLDIVSPLSSGANYGRVYYYDSSKTYLGSQQPSVTTKPEHYTTAEYDESVQIVDWAAIKAYYTSIREAETAYVRFGGIPADEIIITDGENIQ